MFVGLVPLTQSEKHGSLLPPQKILRMIIQFFHCLSLRVEIMHCQNELHTVF